jgi:hypothetical protein
MTQCVEFKVPPEVSESDFEAAAKTGLFSNAEILLGNVQGCRSPSLVLGSFEDMPPQREQMTPRLHEVRFS